MGYGTKQHLEAIEVHGVLDEHRKSFAPIKDMIQKISCKYTAYFLFWHINITIFEKE